MGYAQLRIDAAAILANYKTLQQSGLTIWPVLKANAYGVGIQPVLSAFAQHAVAPGCMCLATLEEAQEARQLGWQQDILLLSPLAVADLPPAIELGVTPWCHCHTLAEAWLQTAPTTINLNINTGMQRYGMDVHEALALAQQSSARGIAVSAGTHHANADLPDLAAAHRQQTDWQTIAGQLGAAVQKHSCNSAATLRGLQAAGDSHARCGLALYGIAPPGSPQLQPAVALQSRVVQVRRLAKGQGISYGHEFVAAQDMTVGIVACGYADGIPVYGASNITIQIGAHQTHLTGRVTMDAVAIDLSHVPESEFDSTVTLIGSHTSNSIQAWADASLRTPYEILTGLGRRPQRILV